jgi:hypothetical protein
MEADNSVRLGINNNVLTPTIVRGQKLEVRDRTIDLNIDRMRPGIRVNMRKVEISRQRAAIQVL